MSKHAIRGLGSSSAMAASFTTAARRSPRLTPYLTSGVIMSAATMRSRMQARTPQQKQRDFEALLFVGGGLMGTAIGLLYSTGREELAADLTLLTGLLGTVYGTVQLLESYPVDDLTDLFNDASPAGGVAEGGAMVPTIAMDGGPVVGVAPVGSTPTGMVAAGDVPVYQPPVPDAPPPPTHMRSTQAARFHPPPGTV